MTSSPGFPSTFACASWASTWCFELDGVAERCLYLDQIWATHTIEEVGQAILAFQKRIKPRPWRGIPL
ncbi:MAG: hypothetical protein AB7S38_40590 [Vulcanimicrobiota bacterium]